MAPTSSAHASPDNALFEGGFIPPKVASAVPSLPIGGYGSIEITDDALLLRGVQINTSYLLLGLLFFIAFSLIIVGGMTISLGAISIPFFLAGIAGLYFNYVLLRRKQKTPDGPDTEIRIPLDKIKEITHKGAHLRDGEMTILVKKHKPEGMIHFYPKDSTEEVSQAIERALRS